jgi:cyclohexadieny/prephenate dehydrogenase
VAIQTLTIVGVGLIGGSIGLAAKQRGLAKRVLGVGRRQASLQEALHRGAIDEVFVDSLEAVRQADVAVICTPVDLIADQVLAAAPHCKPGALLTDAGSTKAALVRTLDGRMPAGVSFVGSHPLAGSEKRGPEHADANLFDGKLTVITPTAQTNGDVLDRVTAFWRALGSEVLVMDAEEHDRSLALTSHVPHLVAAALATLLTPELIPLTSTGFRDTTRVAAGDPALWTGIFLQNRQAMLAGLDRLGANLDRFRQALESSDRATLDRLLAQSKSLRDAINDSSLSVRHQALNDKSLERRA